MLQLIVIGCLVIALLALGTMIERRLMQHYWRRACTGKSWRKRFPATPKIEIREFLDVFVETFGFADKQRFRFAPDDRVLDVYRTLYPVRGSADAMELESLVGALEKKYRVAILGTWREDITLGDLFQQTRSRQ
jgi:propanediol dehydratase small subunit